MAESHKLSIMFLYPPQQVSYHFKLKNKYSAVPKVSQKLFWQKKLKAKRDIKYVPFIFSLWIKRVKVFH